MFAENPFVSHRVRPGAIDFVFGEGENTSTLVERLRAANWCGQIIGPHGSGKSTLLQTLMPALRDAGRDVCYVRFQGGKLIAGDALAAWWNQSTQVIIDGYEQLSPLGRMRWRSACRWRNCGLLVTAHRDAGLPLVYETRVDGELARRVANELLDGENYAGAREVISHDDIDAALQLRQNNLRDTLFDLYDLYERRHRRSAVE